MRLSRALAKDPWASPAPRAGRVYHSNEARRPLAPFGHSFKRYAAPRIYSTDYRSAPAHEKRKKRGSDPEGRLRAQDAFVLAPRVGIGSHREDPLL